jgi:hypothetical protein
MSDKYIPSATGALALQVNDEFALGICRRIRWHDQTIARLSPILRHGRAVQPISGSDEDARY